MQKPLDLVGARGAATRGQSANRRRSSRRWATRATHGTTAGRRSSGSKLAQSATCAKCTSGRTGRSPTGRRASRGPQPQRIATELRWDMPASWRVLPTRWDFTPYPRGSRGTCFSARRRRWNITRVYHPFNWRGWVDWGVGAIGDMGAHLIDHAYWAFDLGYPDERSRTCLDAVRQVVLSDGDDDVLRVPGAWRRCRPVKLTWYDGGLLPPKPEEIGKEPLNADRRRAARWLEREIDVRHLRAEAAAASQVAARSHGAAGADAATNPDEPRDQLGRRAKGKGEASTPFEYAARLTEVMLLGIVALRAGTKIHYDGAKMRITNSADCERFSVAGISEGMDV